MVLKSNNSTSYKRQMTVARRHDRAQVGETYGSRQANNYGGVLKSEAPDKAGKASFFTRLKDKIFGVGSFAPAEYVKGSPTIPTLYKELEQGIKESHAIDEDLISILNEVEKVCPK